MPGHQKPILTVLKFGSFKGSSRKDYNDFEDSFLNALNIYAPLETRMLIFNNRSFTSKKLRKETMKRSKCNKNCNKNRNYENSCEYKYQRNYYMNPLKKKKFLYQCNQKLKLNRLQTLLTQIWINFFWRIAKLKSHGFLENALKLMRSYFHFSPDKKVQAGVPQGSIYVPLLFNLCINEIKLFYHFQVPRLMTISLTILETNLILASSLKITWLWT